MSDFSSMLSALKHSASRVESSDRKPARKDAASAVITAQPRQQGRKRSRHSERDGDFDARAVPRFPHMHSSRRPRGAFELNWLVIGAQKAGTSWCVYFPGRVAYAGRMPSLSSSFYLTCPLVCHQYAVINTLTRLHAQLSQCSRLRLPKNRKECHFFDWNLEKGFDWYSGLFGDERENCLTGEVTPDYVVLSPSTIREIHNCFPDLKIVFLARNLASRAFSAMTMELRQQCTGLNCGEFSSDATVPQQTKRGRLESKLSVAQQRRLQEQSSPDSMPDSYFMDRLSSKTHLSRSDYATHLRNWYDVFDDENILLVDFEEISKPREVLTKIAMHIGVKQDETNAFVGSLSCDEVIRKVNANAGKCALSERPRLERQITEYLAPFSLDFNRLLALKGYDFAI